MHLVKVSLLVNFQWIPLRILAVGLALFVPVLLREHSSQTLTYFRARTAHASDVRSGSSGGSVRTNGPMGTGLSGGPMGSALPIRGSPRIFPRDPTNGRDYWTWRRRLFHRREGQSTSFDSPQEGTLEQRIGQEAAGGARETTAERRKPAACVPERMVLRGGEPASPSRAGETHRPCW